MPSQRESNKACTCVWKSPGGTLSICKSSSTKGPSWANPPICLFKGPKWTDCVTNDQVKQGHIKNSWLANVTLRPKEDKGCWSVVNQPRDTDDPRLTSAVRRTPSILQPGASVVKFPHERLILANELDAWDPDWVLLRNEGFLFTSPNFSAAAGGGGERDGEDYATHTHTNLISHTRYAHVSRRGCTWKTTSVNVCGLASGFFDDCAVQLPPLNNWILRS